MPDVIYMKKKELLAKLNKNLALHKKIYKDALDAFKTNYINRLNIMLNTLRKENKFIMDLDLLKPENHADDYIRAINMVKMNCRNEIALREDEFNQYVLNRWDWIRSFHLSYIRNFASSSCSATPSISTSRSSAREVEAYFSGVD